MREAKRPTVVTVCRKCKGQHVKGKKCDQCGGSGIMEYEKKSFRDQIIEKS